MKKKFICVSRYLFFTMLALGMIEEAGNDVIRGHHSALLLQKQEMYLLCVGMLLLYLIPFGLFIYAHSKKWCVSLKFAICSFIAGWFIPGWICGDINDDLAALYAHTSPFLKNTLDALEPAFVEETMKVLVVFWLLSLSGRFLKKHVFIAGMGVGLGFQFAEDLTYIVDFLEHHYVSALKFTLTDRMSSCLISHTLYTCVMAMGIYYIFKEHRYQRGLLCVFTSLFTHALFDSIFSYPLFVALSGGLLLYVFYELYQEKAVMIQ